MSLHTKTLRLVALLATMIPSAFMTKAQDIISLKQSDVNSLYKTTQRGWASVHDPSVVHTSGSTFYIVGSHNGFAQSTDNMVNWAGISNNYYARVNANGTVSRCTFAEAYTSHAVKRVTVLADGQPTEVDFGNFDAKAWAHGDQQDWDISGNMWAPDLIYNPHMKKWCMYMSINGDNWHSLVVMLAADQITGPYVYQGPVVFSGFINNTVPEISYKKTDLELVLGKQNTLPSRYNLGRAWGDTYPNNIDPCTFWDEEGELWMAYGSWSGGIFMLKLDKKTGLRDYTTTYPLAWNGSSLQSDPYFGKHIAGGYYVSGEGPYIQHIGNYYYLFMSYGGFAPDGGYEMRIFRSAKPDGPYVDAQNTSPIYTGPMWNVGPGAGTNRGMKLMAAYNGWGFQTVGECAQGHNSATGDDKGRNFVIYHTKFNDGTIGHQVRTRQLFLNQQGWLCAAPFQFDGETENDDSIARRCYFAPEQIPGSYDVLIHRYRLDHENMEEVTPIHITLTDAGRITGDLSGSWALTEGTGYIRLTMGGVAYYGVVVPQQVDGTTMKAIGITGTATTGVALWAYKMLPQYAVAYTAKQYTIPVKAGQSVNANLPLWGAGAFGATIEWESSHPSVISDAGRYNPADTATSVVLTCRIQAENYVFERSYKVTAQRATELIGDYRSGLLAFYDFDAKPTRNLYDREQTAYYGRCGQGTIPTLEEHPERDGKIVQFYAGKATAASFLRMPNPLEGRQNLEGFSISAWVYRQDDDLLGSLWGFTDKNPSTPTAIAQRLFFTGNTFLGFDDGTNAFEFNRPNDAGTNATQYIPCGEWAFVTVSISAEEGITLFVNGTKKTVKTFTSTAGTASTALAASRLFDYKHVIDFITAAPYISLGAGSPDGTPNVCVDNLLVHDRALSVADARVLNTMANRVTDFGPDGVGIQALPSVHESYSDTPYDLSGRPAAIGKPGLYIIRGRKVLIK